MPKVKRHSPAMKAHVREIAHEVEHLPDQAILHVRRTLGDVKRELQGAFAGWFQGRDLTQTMTSRDYHALVRRIRAGTSRPTTGPLPKVPQWVDALETDLHTGLSRATVGAGQAAAKHIQRQAMGLEAHQKQPIKPVRSAEVVERGAKALEPRLTGAAETVAQRAFDDIKRKALVSVTQEENVGAFATRLTGKTQEAIFGARPIRSAEGIANRLRAIEAGEEMAPETVARASLSIVERLGEMLENQVERVIRTEVQNAYNVMAGETITALGKENPDMVMLKRWDSELDADVCEDCQELHGDTVEVDEEFEAGVGEPPLHPHCRCMLTIITEPRRTDDKSDAGESN